MADELDVPQSARPLIDLLPDAVVDEALPTDAVLRRSLAKVDVDTILNGLNDPSGLEPVLRDAVIKGESSLQAHLAGIRARHCPMQA